MQCYGSVAEIETFGKGCAGRDVGIFIFFCPFKLHLNAVDSAMSLNERPMVFTLQLMPMCNLWDSLMVSYISHHLWCVSCFFIGRVSDRDLAGAVESPHELPACQLHQSPTSQNPCHFYRLFSMCIPLRFESKWFWCDWTTKYVFTQRVSNYSAGLIAVNSTCCHWSHHTAVTSLPFGHSEIALDRTIMTSRWQLFIPFTSCYLQATFYLNFIYH